jgi:hypothetical protein
MEWFFFRRRLNFLNIPFQIFDSLRVPYFNGERDTVIPFSPPKLLYGTYLMQFEVRIG